MATTFELNTELRNEHGTALSRKLRRDKKVPAVIYGAGKDTLALTLDHDEVLHALENEAFYSHILTIKVDGKAEQAVLRDVQRHPFKPKILHLDLQRISAKEKLHMNVPLHFIGEEDAPGVKQDNGIVSHLESSVEISCLPADLPEYIEVNVANLELGSTIHLSELKLPKGVELIELQQENDLPVVSIHLPRAAIEEEVVEETPETEVINQKAEGDEAEDEDKGEEGKAE